MMEGHADHIEICCTTCGNSLDEAPHEDWAVVVDQRTIEDNDGDEVYYRPNMVRHVFCTQDCFRIWIAGNAPSWDELLNEL